MYLMPVYMPMPITVKIIFFLLILGLILIFTALFNEFAKREDYLICLALGTISTALLFCELFLLGLS